MEEAPTSPKSAALYYWGGNNNTFNGIMDDDPKHSEFYWEEVQPPKRNDWRSRVSSRRSQLKFSLSIDDDEDDSHWMFVRPHSQISLGGCFVERDVGVDEKVDDDGFDQEDGVVEAPGNEGVVEVNDFDSIPIVDLSLPLEGPDGYASRIGEACRSSGFFYITNHGVDQKLMQSVMESSRRFFELSLDDKLACGKRDGDSSSGGYRGYFGIGMEDLENKDGTRDLAKEEGAMRKGNGDQKEGFDCGLEAIPGYHENPISKQAYLDFFGENFWPDESKHSSIVGFHETLVQYQKALLQLSNKLMTALAISLASNNIPVPVDYFTSQSRNPMCTLRLLHYPPAARISPKESNDMLKSATGCGAHTDYGLFTILQQDSIGGLQVRNKSNTWIDARPLPGSFVINVGDMLSWWTQGEYASTVHRVVSPALMDGSGVGKHRYSVPFFFNPNHDCIVRPIRNVETKENEKFKTAIDILKERYAGTFKSR